MADTSRPNRGGNSFTVSQNALSVTAETIAEAREDRTRLVVKNNDGSIAVYVGDSLGVASNSGFALAAGESIAIYSTAAVFAIAASGTPTVSILEEYEA